MELTKPEASSTVVLREIDEHSGLHRTLVLHCDNVVNGRSCGKVIAMWPREPWMRNVILTELLDEDVQAKIAAHHCDS